jgi:hypothetical protein
MKTIQSFLSEAIIFLFCSVVVAIRSEWQTAAMLLLFAIIFFLLEIFITRSEEISASQPSVGQNLKEHAVE